MSIGRLILRAIVLGGLAALMVALGASSAWAAPSTHCVKATKEFKIISGKPKKVYTGGWTNSACTATSPTHEGKYEYLKTTSLSEPEQEELKALLKYVKVQPSGVAGKPTVQVSGANVQIVNGEGKTATTNGAGNLVIGYDENPLSRPQTGSHDVIFGEEQEFTSYGGMVGGLFNAITGPYDSVTGGEANTASGGRASVSGGAFNTANGTLSSVSGGYKNSASAAALYSSVSGGHENKAEGQYASVSGGGLNTASGPSASVSGGLNNTASGDSASVTGGQGNTADLTRASVSGGSSNTAGGEYSSVSGGEKNSAFTAAAWLGGGNGNKITGAGKAGEEGKFAAIFGGKGLSTVKDYDAIP
jgi:hypothetical protein